MLYTIYSKIKQVNVWTRRFICNLMKQLSKAGVFMSKHSSGSHVAFGDALSLPLSCRSSLSHFQSPRGCIKGPGFSPNQHSALRAKPPPGAEPENFCTKETRVDWKRGSACELLCRSWLDAKTGRFPFSGAEKPLLFVEKTITILPGLWHCLALYAEASPKL